MLEILDYEETELGPLCLRRRELLRRPGTTVTEVTLNHEFLMSSYLTESERALAERGIALHGGRDLRVLIGGLGLGYTAAAALAAEGVSRVEVVEYLRPVIGWLERDLVPLAAALKADRRLAVSQGDIYGRLAGEAAAEHDVVLIDVDHSPDDALGEQSEGFYTAAGLERARRHLAPGGVLGVWSYAESTPLADAMRRQFPTVQVERVTVFNDLIDVEQTDWLLLAKSE